MDLLCRLAFFVVWPELISLHFIRPNILHKTDISSTTKVKRKIRISSTWISRYKSDPYLDKKSVHT